MLAAAASFPASDFLEVYEFPGTRPLHFTNAEDAWIDSDIFCISPFFLVL
jgi:hypothetical protein